MTESLADLIIKHGPYSPGDAPNPELMATLMTASGMNSLRDELIAARGLLTAINGLAERVRRGEPL